MLLWIKLYKVSLGNKKRVFNVFVWNFDVIRAFLVKRKKELQTSTCHNEPVPVIKWKSVKTRYSESTPHHSESSVWDQELPTTSAPFATTRLGLKSMKIQEKWSFARIEDSLLWELSSLQRDADMAGKNIT